MEKLSIIGSKINLAIKNSRENWRQLIKINGNVPSILKLYGKFSIHIMNEKNLGKMLIDRSKKLAIKQLEAVKDGEAEGLEDLSDPVPFSLVGSIKGEQGYIKKVNLLFSSLFGYYKEEIIEKKIKTIMPTIYADNHDKFLQAFLDSRAL
jgi:hypothetical protein